MRGDVSSLCVLIYWINYSIHARYLVSLTNDIYCMIAEYRLHYDNMYDKKELIKLIMTDT